MIKYIMYAVLVFGVCLSDAHAVDADVPVSRVEVRVAPTGVSEGGRIPVGVRFSMDPGWHTYAENPGDSGLPPDITVNGPEGLHVERWAFPPAKTFTDAAGTTYGYEGEVVLLGALTLPPAAVAAGSMSLTFDIYWMVCKDVCIPLEATVRMRLSTEAGASAQRLDWEAFLEAGGWSACVEPESGEEKPGKETACRSE